MSHRWLSKFQWESPPTPDERSVRESRPNYGWYASRTRGIRRRAGTEGQQTVYAASVPVPLREARRRWAELLRRIFEVEPLECPRCGQTMRIVAFITEPQVIDRSGVGPRRAPHACFERARIGDHEPPVSRTMRCRTSFTAGCSSASACFHRFTNRS